MITSDQLKKEVKKIFPKLKYLWIWQPNFDPPTLDQLREEIRSTTVDQMDYIEDKIDCDVFSLLLHAEVIKNEIKNNSSRKPFGQVFVDKHQGKKELHKLNVCYTQSGLYFIEPQTDQIWLANKESDNPLFMEFI